MVTFVRGVQRNMHAHIAELPFKVNLGFDHLIPTTSRLIESCVAARPHVRNGPCGRYRRTGRQNQTKSKRKAWSMLDAARAWPYKRATSPGGW